MDELLTRILHDVQLQDYDMCIARNEEALRIQPQFAECYGNMANAWKVTGLAFASSSVGYGQ